MLWSEFDVKYMKVRINESMDPNCLVSRLQTGTCGEMFFGIFSCHILGALIASEHSLPEYCCRLCPSLCD